MNFEHPTGRKKEIPKSITIAWLRPVETQVSPSFAVSIETAKRQIKLVRKRGKPSICFVRILGLRSVFYRECLSQALFILYHFVWSRRKSFLSCDVEASPLYNTRSRYTLHDVVKHFLRRRHGLSINEITAATKSHACSYGSQSADRRYG